MTFGEIFKEHRTRAGLKQEEVAQLLNCSASYIPYVESSKRFPSIEFCLAFVKEMRLTPEERDILLNAVEEARQERDRERSQIRANALGALGTLSASAAFAPDADVQRLAHEIAVDDELKAVHDKLRLVLRHSVKRRIALNTIHALLDSLDN